jgi:hypothetical protein
MQILQYLLHTGKTEPVKNLTKPATMFFPVINYSNSIMKSCDKLLFTSCNTRQMTTFTGINNGTAVVCSNSAEALHNQDPAAIIMCTAKMYKLNQNQHNYKYTKIRTTLQIISI